MFDILFGWRKASKCKELIRRVQCRLKLLKNKRFSIVRQLREDVGQLLKLGQEQSAFNRVEQLYKDETIMAAYELLDHFCEFIIIHLSYIRKHKDCPNDINEAVSSLIFASARCGDLPELRAIRKLFGERYGQRFAMTAVELFHGNLVNREVKEKLSIKSVPDDVKHRLVDEIFREYCFKPGPLALEYSSEWQQMQVERSRGDQILDKGLHAYHNLTKRSQMQDSDVKEIEEKAIYIDCDVTSISTSSPKVENSMHGVAEKAKNCAQLGSPYDFTVSSLHTIENQSSRRIYNASLEHKEDRMAASSSESSSHFPEEAVVFYLEDIEEFQSPNSKDGNFQDQRLFMFKSSILAKCERIEDKCVVQYDSLNEKASSVSSRTGRKASGKRLRKRSISRENRSMMDVDWVNYYGESCLSSPSRKHASHRHTKHPKKICTEESQQSYYTLKRSNQPGVVGFGSSILNSACRFDAKKPCCTLEDPCYFCTGDDRDKLRMQYAPLKQKPGKNNGIGAVTAEVSACRNHPSFKQNKLTERKAESPASSKGSCSNVTSPSTRKGIQAPYLRAVTMPLERAKAGSTDNIIRANSCSFQQLNHRNHVHPKLPDYDELEAKFTALKKEYLQNKRH